MDKKDRLISSKIVAMGQHGADWYTNHITFSIYCLYINELAHKICNNVPYGAIKLCMENKCPHLFPGK